MFAKLLRDRTDSTFVQLFRYLLVGGVAFVFDFGPLAALTELAGLHYLLSATFAFLVGLMVNYCLSIWWVFSQRKLRSKTAEFVVFALVGVVGLGLNDLCIWTLTEYLHLHYLVSKVVSTGLVLFWNFFARRFLLFTKPDEAKG